MKFDKIDKIWGNMEITTKLSRLKSVSSTDDDYLEAATGGVLADLESLLKRDSNTSVFLCMLGNF